MIIDIHTGRSFDDLKPVIEVFDFLTDADRPAVFESDSQAVFPRLKTTLQG